ncbi:calcium-binding atopy-related autoantigen-like protein [Phytophthora cinnamomi]|uniref:calcium-binding atopy-related autoantigen-like protein n=1 Tax=Phytophthora cinnamomi TaxID=4785 RepID=UPI0035596A5D|nr:calcium-binding atopy-related autoantigen-like protein [Phytophthora cinnamomi]
MAEPVLPLAAPAAALQPWRERLLRSKVFMRYDYAWKEVEFQDADSRISGVGCRLLYLHAAWVETYNHCVPSDVSTPRTKAYIEPNGFVEFQERLRNACELMGYDVVADPMAADLLFVYVAPPAEQRSAEGQFETFKSVVEHAKDKKPDEKPLFCFLLGDADFLPLPKTEEAESMRSLSDFAISQEFAPIAGEAEYGSVAQFAVEFVPESVESLSDEFKEDKTRKLDSLMSRFGCVGQNLMHHTEKWEFYAPSESVFCHGEDDPKGVTHPSEDDTMFWFKETKGKTCDQCHAPSEKLSKCARCRDAVYCSRECQKAAWKLHKRLCGKTPEEISAPKEEKK